MNGFELQTVWIDELQDTMDTRVHLDGVPEFLCGRKTFTEEESLNIKDHMSHKKIIRGWVEESSVASVRCYPLWRNRAETTMRLLGKTDAEIYQHFKTQGKI